MGSMIARPSVTSARTGVSETDPTARISEAAATQGRAKSYGFSERKIGAGDEIRTHDFNLGKVALYP